MTSVLPQNIRNVVLAGPGAGGKKTLAEELLFRSKAIAKKGSVEKGDAVMITEAEDASRQTSITVHTAYFTWKDHLFHLFDTPGYFSFLENLRPVIPAADGALLVVSGMYPAKPETSRIWQMLKEYSIPCLGFISGMDDASADFGRALSGLKEGVEIPVLPAQIPIRTGGILSGVIDLISQKAFDAKGAEIAVPDDLKAEIEVYRLELIEKIAEASDELGVTWRLKSSVVAVDEQGVTLGDGQRIEAKTVIWTTGVRASSLTAQIPGERDGLGRLHVDAHLQVIGQQDIFATGDVAYAATDDLGNHALMTCQHAIVLGRHAGNNVAAQILGVAPVAYSQPKYVTCLDLGGWGAVYTEGWDRQVKLTRQEGKSLKTQINTVWIYPPAADRDVAWAAADPLIPIA